MTPSDSEPIQSLGLTQPALSPAEVPDADNLQFRTAMAEGTHPCAICRHPVDGNYYHVAGNVCCVPCSEARLAEQNRRGGLSEFGRALLWGAGAALAGSALYAVVLLATGMNFALLAIVVGFMVGKAVVAGAKGCRGRKYQVLAVLLTYGAITTSYIPQFITIFREHSLKRKATAKSAAQAAPSQSTPASAPKTPPVPTVAALAVLSVFLVGLALVAPFLALFDGIGGIINLFIIFIGLSRAWRMTRADNVVVAGPYPMSDLAAAAASR